MRSALLALVLLVGCSSKSEKPNPWIAEAKKCGDSELACARPIANVKSLKAAQAYYHDKLGFHLDWDHEGNFGAVSRGNYQLFLCEQCLSSPGIWTMTFTKDVDKLHEEFAKRGAIIRMPPTNMPWGLRELHVDDIDGNVIRFGAAIDDDH